MNKIKFKAKYSNLEVVSLATRGAYHLNRQVQCFYYLFEWDRRKLEKLTSWALLATGYSFRVPSWDLR